MSREENKHVIRTFQELVESNECYWSASRLSVIFIKNRKCKHRKFLFQFGGSFSTVFFSFLQNPLVGYFGSSPQDIDVCLGTIKDKYHLIMLVRTNW